MNLTNRSISYTSKQSVSLNFREFSIFDDNFVTSTCDETQKLVKYEPIYPTRLF